MMRNNRLEVVRGDRARQYSIRINRQWRICFIWPDTDPGPFSVEIVALKETKKAMFKRTVHPGLILKDELDELGITLTEFANQIDVPVDSVLQIIGGHCTITGDTALRFGHWFGTDTQFWTNLQAQFDLAVAHQKTGAAIEKLPTRTSFAERKQGDQPRLV